MSKKVPATGGQGSRPPAGAVPPQKIDVRKNRPRAAPPPEPWVTRAAIRETVESIVIAFVLAFLFRAFEAEAFVIPTGSMATTLMGRHKDVECTKCGFVFHVGSSEEVDPMTNELKGARVLGGICPNCRYAMSFAASAAGKAYDSFNGDRIIVAKYPYHLRDPERFDVVVFQYPGEAKTNYIKRLVGLPNESIRIHRGDVFAKPDGAAGFTIARKPPSKILSMMRPVYDADFQPAELRAAGFPARWFDLSAADKAAGDASWRADGEDKSFAFEGAGDAWLCYRHLPPTREAWGEVFAEGHVQSRPRPQLITDFAGYNTQLDFRPAADQADVAGELDRQVQSRLHFQRLGLHWVGDLIVEATVEIQRSSGSLDLVLVKAGRRHVCRIDLSTGAATLQIDGLAKFQPKAATALSKPGKYELRWANVDGQLHLWVDGRVAAFDAPTTFEAPADALPDREDLRPVRIGAHGAAVRVSHLRVFRDMYYIACKAPPGNFRDHEDETVGSPDMWDFPNIDDVGHTPEALAAFYSDPTQWRRLTDLKTARFDMKADEFFMLGDNSPESKDGRLWEGGSAGVPREHFVRRGLIKGKAIFIYWPHSWDRLPGTDRWASTPNGVWFPYFPNFSRMGFIR